MQHFECSIYKVKKENATLRHALNELFIKYLSNKEKKDYFISSFSTAEKLWGLFNKSNEY